VLADEIEDPMYAPLWKQLWLIASKNMNRFGALPE